MRSHDGVFPDQSILARKKSCVLKLSDLEYFLYSVPDKTLVTLRTDEPEDLRIVEEARSGLDHRLAYGSVHYHRYEQHLLLTLDIEYGGASYLFVSGPEGWKPVTCTGGWIE